MRWVRLLVVALLVASSAGIADLATAAGGNTRAERERVRREQAQKAAELDVLRAEDSKVEAALAAMNSQVAAQQQQLASAEQAVAASEAEASEAKAAETAIEQKVALLQASLRDMAVQEFITGGRLKVDQLAFTDDLSEVARRTVMADIAIGSATVVRQQLRAASEDLTLARERAEEAAAAAVVQRDAVDAHLGELAAARDQQADFAAKLDQRIESRLAESAALAALDATLSAEIARQQAALARANAAAAARSTVRRAPTRTVVRGNTRLRTVRGITVATEIADELERMLAAAERDGIVFGGGGYRDPAQQQALRDAHCPYDDAPSTACRPPTARPGHSMHERGLAVDFTMNGRTLTSSSPGYRWLRANAASYGFYNLPGEPWHWSTNGN